MIPLLDEKLDALPLTKIVLFHGDFAFRNMMVARDNEGRLGISALLDWEWCGTMPIYADWLGDWLEEETEDKIENRWIREQQMEQHQFPVFSNLKCYELRKKICELVDALEPWRFEDKQEEACKKALELFQNL